MAIRKSRDESFEVAGLREATITRCVIALKNGGFSSIECNEAIGQITAKYHKFTVWGEIEVTIKEKAREKSVVETHVTANMDNVFALFSSPINKIANAFKRSL